MVSQFMKHQGKAYCGLFLLLKTCSDATLNANNTQENVEDLGAYIV